MNPTKKWMTYGIMLALIAWGVYLAIGATGMFVQKDMMDVRKSGIVIACVALFLGLWAIVLFGTKNKANASQTMESQTGESQTGSSAVSPARSWSRPGIASLGFAILGSALWGIAIASWQQVSLGATTVLGWIAAFCVLAAATSGMIALSSKQAKRGKWFGALGLIGFLGAFVVFVARMTP